MWNVGMGIDNYCSILNVVLFLYFFHPYIPIFMWKRIFVSCKKTINTKSCHVIYFVQCFNLEDWKKLCCKCVFLCNNEHDNGEHNIKMIYKQC